MVRDKRMHLKMKAEYRSRRVVGPKDILIKVKRGRLTFATRRNRRKIVASSEVKLSYIPRWASLEFRCRGPHTIGWFVDLQPPVDDEGDDRATRRRPPSVMASMSLATLPSFAIHHRSLCSLSIRFFRLCIVSFLS